MVITLRLRAPVNRQRRKKSRNSGFSASSALKNAFSSSGRKYRSRDTSLNLVMRAAGFAPR